MSDTDDTMMLTIFLKHQQNKNLAEIKNRPDNPESHRDPVHSRDPAPEAP